MKSILILGLGAGDLDQLSLGIYKLIKNAKEIYLRTESHPVVKDLKEEGIIFRSFDSVYEKYDSFEEVYEEITETLLKLSENGSVIYAVPGHPLVAERTVQLLLERGEQRGIEVKIGGGQSFLDTMFQALRIDPIEGFQLLDATALNRDEFNLKQHIIIGQVYDTYTASDVKLTLMEKLPYDYEVYIVTAAGSSQEEVRKVELYELDREVNLNNLTSVYVPPVKDEKILYKEFSKFREIIAELRGPNGCPWDKEQTHQSLKKYLIEEAYELIEAIDKEDIDHMIEELGDVLLQIVLHAQIGEDDGYFTIDEVIQNVSKKMVRRHPHVFGHVQAETAEDVIRNWEEIKKEEKGEKETSILDGVGTHLPNLMRAYELQKRAKKVGFDWDHVDQAWEKVNEEINEFKTELEDEGKPDAITKEFGDILFAIVNIARFYHINPEEALFGTNQKFMNRFSYIEEKVKESGKSFENFTLEQLDQLWEEAKEKGL